MTLVCSGPYNRDMENINSLNDPHWFQPGFIGPYFDITARREYLKARADVLGGLCAQNVLDGIDPTWYARRWQETQSELRRLEDYTASRINWGAL